MNSQPQKCAAWEARRRPLAMEAAFDRGDPNLWPAFRENIAGMDTHRLASLVVWVEDDPDSSASPRRSGRHGNSG